MKRKYYKKVMSVLISTGVITSLVGQVQAFANESDMINKALKSIKTQNIQTNINLLENIEIDPEINTNKDEEINVIVQLKGDAVTLSNEKINSSHNKFKDFVNKLNKTKSVSNIKLKEEYTKVFNGISLKMKSSDVKKLLDSDEVQKVWLDKEVKIDPVIEKESKSSNKKETRVDSVKQIEADRLHEKGITGKGVKVGVLDTGLDYNHPDIKDNYKGGYDCINEDDDPMETTYEDWKNSGKPEYLGNSYYYTEHGTHVAGSVAGSGKSNLDQAVKGVAPDADLYAYKVLGPYGSGSFSDVIQGIEMAVEDKMDVINLSLGVDSNDPYSPVSQAVNNAMLRGTTVVMASGNNGPDVGTVGSPGAASFPITVGASSASVTRTLYEIEIGNNEYEIKSIAKDFDDNINKLEDKEYEIVYVDNGDSYDYEKLGIESVKDQIVLINYRSGNLPSKIKLANEKGAKATIFYSERGEVDFIDEDKDYIPSFTLDSAYGKQIKDLVDKGENKVEFDKSEKIVDGSEELAWFSSQGPGYYEYDIKPDVVAPGIDVYSIVPSYVNDKENNNYDYAYERMNGTSMASPHVTGACALLKQVNKKATPFDIKKSLMNTSEKLDKDYGVNEVGSGRINVYDAVNDQINISIEDSTKIFDGNDFVDVKRDTGSLSFGSYSDEELNKGVEREKNINIKNTSSKDKIFTVDVNFYNDYPASDANSNKVEIKNISNEIKINKKSEKTITPTIVVPKGAEAGSYQGYITFTNKNDKDENYQVPFSINFAKDGIKNVEHLREGTSTKYDELFDPLVEAGIEFGSHMTEISVFVQDYNTKKIIGISGSANISQVPINTPVRLGAFNGIILPIDENGNVVNEFMRLSEGDYNLIYHTKDSLGKEYIASDYIWVDNTTPEIYFDKKPGVYEVDSTQTTFDIKGKSYDKGIENVMSKTETYLDQSWTNVYKYKHNNFGSLELIIPEVDGSFSTTHKLDNTQPINKIAMSAIDIFGAGGLREKHDYYLIQKDTPYVYSSFDKTLVNHNETFNMSVEMDNISSFESGEFVVNYINNHQILDAKLSDEFINMANSQGYEFEVVLDESNQENDVYNSSKISINPIVKGESEFVIDEKVKVFDISLKAERDTYYDSSESDVFEEVLIKSSTINGNNFKNTLNTNFIYNIAK